MLIFKGLVLSLPNEAFFARWNRTADDNLYKGFHYILQIFTISYSKVCQPDKTSHSPSEQQFVHWHLFWHPTSFHGLSLGVNRGRAIRSASLLFLEHWLMRTDYWTIPCQIEVRQPFRETLPNSGILSVEYRVILGMDHILPQYFAVNGFSKIVQ